MQTGGMSGMKISECGSQEFPEQRCSEHLPSLRHRGLGCAGEFVPQLVAKIANMTPDAVALQAGQARMSYGELDARAGRLAGHLRSLGVGREVPVGVCLERSFDQVVALLAILKAGGAFLPLDPAWPDERLRELLDDARAAVLVGRAARVGELGGGGRVAVPLDRLGDIATAQARARSPRMSRARTLPTSSTPPARPARRRARRSPTTTSRTSSPGTWPPSR